MSDHQLENYMKLHGRFNPLNQLYKNLNISLALYKYLSTDPSHYPTGMAKELEIIGWWLVVFYSTTYSFQLFPLPHICLPLFDCQETESRQPLHHYPSLQLDVASLLLQYGTIWRSKRQFTLAQLFHLLGNGVWTLDLLHISWNPKLFNETRQVTLVNTSSFVPLLPLAENFIVNLTQVNQKSLNDRNKACTSLRFTDTKGN